MRANSLLFTVETKEKFNIYIDLLKVWQKKFNLISNTSMDSIWERHIIDSAQLFPLIPREKKGSFVYDIGTGAGFPGMVLAIMGRKDIVLCESSHKKCAFLKEVRKKIGVNVIIDNIRAERLPAHSGLAVIARAVASLNNLLKLSFPLLLEKGVCIFPKGINWKKELKLAEKQFHIEYELVRSITSKESFIFVIKKIENKYGAN